MTVSTYNYLIKLVLRLPPGPLGLCLKCNLTKGILSVMKVKQTSPCKGQVQANDILVFIDKLEVSKLGVANSVKYLEKRQWERKTLIFERRSRRSGMTLLANRKELKSAPGHHIFKRVDKINLRNEDVVQVLDDDDNGGTPMTHTASRSRFLGAGNHGICCDSNKSTMVVGKTTSVHNNNDDYSKIPTRETSVRNVAKISTTKHCKNDVSTQNDATGTAPVTFQLHMDPGPLGLNIKPRGPLGFEVIQVRSGSQCKGRVFKGDYLVSINDLALYNLTNEYVVNYLNTRKLMNKTITVVTTRSSTRNATPSSLLKSDRFCGTCNHGDNCSEQVYEQLSKEKVEKSNTISHQQKRKQNHVFSASLLQLKRLYNNDGDQKEENPSRNKKCKVLGINLKKNDKENQINDDLEDKNDADTHLYDRDEDAIHDDSFHHNVASPARSDPTFDPSLYTYQELYKFKELSKIICNEMECREVSRLDEIARRIFGNDGGDHDTTVSLWSCS